MTGVSSVPVRLCKDEGVVLRVRPYSRTSHIVTWLMRREGIVVTAAKGAMRPKSFISGQYDLYCTCEVVYYSREHGGVHQLREVSALNLREDLRRSWCGIAAAGYAAALMEGSVVREDAPGCYAFLVRTLDELESDPGSAQVLLERLERQTLDALGWHTPEELGPVRWQRFLGGIFGVDLMRRRRDVFDIINRSDHRPAEVSGLLGQELKRIVQRCDRLGREVDDRSDVGQVDDLHG